MENFLEIIRSRQSPGILVFDFDNRLLFSNREILSLFPGLLPTDPPEGQKNDHQFDVPREIIHLCERVKENHAQDQAGQTERHEKNCALMVEGSEHLLSLRAFMIHGHGGKDRGYIMVLAERVVEYHGRNFEKIRQDYGFSSREMDVLRRVCAGLSNRAIAETLFISEHTVKDHVKNIMKKMQVTSRNEIMATLKS